MLSMIEGAGHLDWRPVCEPCGFAGTVTYDIPSVNRAGEVPIERIVLDNVAWCEALGQ